MPGDTTSSASILARGPRWSLIQPPACGTRPDSFRRSLSETLRESPPRIACRFLYDAEGSRLFERICQLDSYYPTRAEARILEDFSAGLFNRLDRHATVVELGSGSSTKTGALLRAGLSQQERVQYIPIDISPTILEESARRLTREHEALEITAVAAEYTAGLRWVEEEIEDPLLVLWLGSSIGNFSRIEARSFLARLAEMLRDHDRLLVGIDLRKERRTLEAAYDDPEGVTEAFMRNVLTRANRDLGANFDQDRLRYLAHYDELEGVVRMGFVVKSDHQVSFGEEAFALRKGEYLHVEDSQKYSLREIDAAVTGAGLRLEAHFRDPQDRFSLNLLARKSTPAGSAEGSRSP